MKSEIFAGILCSLIFVFSPLTQIPNLEDPYMGLKAPGSTPKRFMTSVHRIHSSPAFSPDLKEVYWSVFPRTAEFSTKTQIILYSKLEKGKWTAPKLASFSGQYFDGGPVFSADGKKLYFYSRRPLAENSLKETDGEIWVVEKTGKTWSHPRHLPIPMNGDKLFFSLDEQGSIYYTSGHGPKGVGSGTVDIFSSQFSKGKYSTIEKLPGSINSDRYIESDALISPDGRYLYDLYVSFRTGEQWSDPVNLGKEINQGYSRFPGLSPDGKYLFFVRRDGVYWVSTKVFEELKPK
jgi:Tol biopolymer transport system component